MKKSLLDLEECMKVRAKITIESGQPLDTTLIMETCDGLVRIRFKDLENGEKAEFEDRLRGMLQTFEASGYVYLDKAWVARGKAAKRILNGGSIFDLPLDDRNEAIHILTVEKGKTVRGLYASILPKTSNSIVKEFSIFDSDEGYECKSQMAILDW